MHIEPRSKRRGAKLAEAEPRITVYIPSHNYGRYLGDAIDSVLTQTVEDWELIVIDDGSSDETSEIMALYKGHPGISLHRTEGIGLPAVCNYALERARGRYVIRLDGDDVFDENALLVLANYLDVNPAAALVFPDYFLVDEYGEVFAHERRRRLYSGNHMLDMPPNGACTLVRTDVLRQLGGYREDLGAQDGFDLWSKMFREYKCANVNLPLFYYRRHGRNLTTKVHQIVNARQEIKKDAITDILSDLRPLIAVIPCRRNFDFETDLWQVEINGRNLLDRDIDACLASSMFDHVIVTADNPEAEAVVRARQDKRLAFIARDPKSTIRTASIVPTLEAVARQYDPELKGITVLRYIQTPFVTSDTLEEAITTLAMSGASSAFAVEEIRSRVFRRTPHGLETLNPRGEIMDEFATLYSEAKTCVATRNANLATGSLTGAAVASFVVSSMECFFIRSAHELKIARLMAAEA